MSQDLEEATKVSQSLARLSHLIRQAIRASNGEPGDDEEAESSNANADPEAGKVLDFLLQVDFRW